MLAVLVRIFLACGPSCGQNSARFFRKLSDPHSLELVISVQLEIANLVTSSNENETSTSANEESSTRSLLVKLKMHMQK
jgi:hypothetical protein